MRRLAASIALLLLLVGCGGAAGAPHEPTPVVAFTFDDAPWQDWAVIKPILDAAGIKVGFAIPSDFPNGNKTLAWRQVDQLQAQGHEIIAHTIDHHHLTQMTPAEQVNEIDNRADYERHGIHVHGFAYPFGEENPQLRETVSHYYEYALATTRRGASSSQEPLTRYAIRRIPITDTTITTDHYAQVDAAIANREILVFVVHAGDGKFNVEGGGAQRLADVIRYVQTKHVAIATPAQAVARAEGRSD